LKQDLEEDGLSSWARYRIHALVGREMSVWLEVCVLDEMGLGVDGCEVVMACKAKGVC